MCDRLRCEKNGQPIIDSCHDCLIPADGPSPDMYRTKTTDRGILDTGENLKNGYAERCANCKWYQMARQWCLEDDTQTSRNLYCEDWEDINGG